MTTWTRDWVYNVIKPFLTQLKNRLGNIKLEHLGSSKIRFTNANGVVSNIDTMPTTQNLITRTPNYGIININSNFYDDKLDYENYVNGTTRKIIHDVVDELQAGSLRVEGSGGTILSSAYYPIPQDREYRATMSVKSLVNGTDIDTNKSFLNYVGVACYDSDKHQISPQHLTIDAYGVLAHDHNLTDTTVTITVDPDSDAFHDGSEDYRSSIRFYNKLPDGRQVYVGENGRIYRDKGMSQWCAYSSYTGNAPIDNGDGTITITLNGSIDQFISNYTNTKPNLKAGDRVVGCRGGGTYNYWISALNTNCSGEWTRYESPWYYQNLDADPTNYDGIYRDGSSYVKFLVLPNYNASSDVVSWYGKLNLEWRYKV